MNHRTCYRLGTVVFLTTLVLLSACRSSKPAAGESDAVTAASGVVARLNANRQEARGIRGKLSISLHVGNGSPLTASGSIKMKRDEIIQLSITALGLLELGRMELTPEYLFIQDRYHKRYIKASWRDIPSLQSAGVDFNTFQALFWNELFVPGQSGIPSEQDFACSTKDKRARLQPREAPKTADLLFYTTEDQTQLFQSTLVARNGAVRFDGTCQSWNTLAGKPFPAALRLAITAGKSYIADLTFTRLQVDESMGDIATKLTDGKYEQVTLEDVLKGLHM